MLPFDPEGGAGVLSPIEATARYLGHLKEAWNHLPSKDEDADFDEQEVVICGISMGYPDWTPVEASLVTERESLGEFVKFYK